MTLRALPNRSLPALREVLRDDGTFLDRDLIRKPGVGRGTIAGLLARGWIVDHCPDGMDRRYLLTPAGRLAITP